MNNLGSSVLNWITTRTSSPGKDVLLLFVDWISPEFLQKFDNGRRSITPTLQVSQTERGPTAKARHPHRCKKVKTQRRGDAEDPDPNVQGWKRRRWSTTEKSDSAERTITLWERLREKNGHSSACGTKKKKKRVRDAVVNLVCRILPMRTNINLYQALVE